MPRTREAAKVLDGLQGTSYSNRQRGYTGGLLSPNRDPAGMLAKSPSLICGWTICGPPGTADGNMKLSEARADAVRTCFWRLACARRRSR